MIGYIVSMMWSELNRWPSIRHTGSTASRPPRPRASPSSSPSIVSYSSNLHFTQSYNAVYCINSLYVLVHRVMIWYSKTYCIDGTIYYNIMILYSMMVYHVNDVTYCMNDVIRIKQVAIDSTYGKYRFWRLARPRESPSSSPSTLPSIDLQNTN